MDYFTQRKNDEGRASNLLLAVDFTSGNAQPNIIDTDEDLNDRIRGLIAKQQQIFGLVHQQARDRKKPNHRDSKKKLTYIIFF